MTETKIVPLPNKPHQLPDFVDENIVHALEKLLEPARAGEVRAFAVTWLDGGGCVERQYDAGSQPTASLLGAATALTMDISRDWTNAAESIDDAG